MVTIGNKHLKGWGNIPCVVRNTTTKLIVPEIILIYSASPRVKRPPSPLELQHIYMPAQIPLPQQACQSRVIRKNVCELDVPTAGSPWGPMWGQDMCISHCGFFAYSLLCGIKLLLKVSKWSTDTPMGMSNHDF